MWIVCYDWTASSLLHLFREPEINSWRCLKSSNPQYWKPSNYLLQCPYFDKKYRDSNNLLGVILSLPSARRPSMRMALAIWVGIIKDDDDRGIITVIQHNSSNILTRFCMLGNLFIVGLSFVKVALVSYKNGSEYILWFLKFYEISYYRCDYTLAIETEPPGEEISWKFITCRKSSHKSMEMDCLSILMSSWSLINVPVLQKNWKGRNKFWWTSSIDGTPSSIYLLNSAWDETNYREGKLCGWTRNYCWIWLSSYIIGVGRMAIKPERGRILILCAFQSYWMPIWPAFIQSDPSVLHQWPDHFYSSH